MKTPPTQPSKQPTPFPFQTRDTSSSRATGIQRATAVLPRPRHRHDAPPSTTGGQRPHWPGRRSRRRQPPPARPPHRACGTPRTSHMLRPSLSVRIPSRRGPRAPLAERAPIRTTVRAKSQGKRRANAWRSLMGAITSADTLHQSTHDPTGDRRLARSQQDGTTRMNVAPRRNATHLRFPRTERHHASSRYPHNSTTQAVSCK